MKKLYKSGGNKILAGVFGGLGEYFDVDPTVLRLIGSFLIIATGLFPGIIFYLAAVIIVPKKNNARSKRA